MSLILFDEVGTPNPNHLCKLFEKYVGLSPQKVGNHFVVTDEQVESKKRLTVIAKETPWDLDEQSYAEVASSYVKEWLCSDLEAADVEWPKTIGVDEKYGWKSDFERLKLQFYFSRGDGLKARLVNDVFPYLHRTHGLNKIFPIRIEAVYFQGWITLAKVPFLIERFGVSEGTKLIKEKRTLNSVVPTAMDVQSYVQALVCAPPSIAGIPLTRGGSGIFARGKGWCGFSRIAVENIFEQLVEAPDSLVGPGDGLHSLLEKSLGNRGMDSLIPKAVSATNSLVSYLNDPRNFAEGGKWQPYIQLKTQAAVKLMFSDFAAMNFSNSLYARQRFAFSLIDKFANLRWAKDGRVRNETEYFEEAFGPQIEREICEIIKSHFRSVSHTVASGFAGAARTTFRSVRSEIAESSTRPRR